MSLSHGALSRSTICDFIIAVKTGQSLERNATNAVYSLVYPPGIALCRSDSCADPGGGYGVRTPPPLKYHKKIGFSSNTGPDLLKITKKHYVVNLSIFIRVF